MKIVWIFFLIMIAGCSKPDEIAPVISVDTPGENQVVTGGQPVIIKATISDNEGIHMVHLTVLDNTTSGHMIHFEEHFDGKTYQLNKSFIAQAGRSYTIDVEATDHHENTAKKQLTISAN